MTKKILVDNKESKKYRHLWWKISRKSVLKRIFTERLTEPLHLNLLSIIVALFGTTRAKINFDLIARQQHAYGLLWAADEAKKLGYSTVTIIELGVAAGIGFLNLCSIASRVTRVTGVNFELIGVDSGKGLPVPRDYRDHPELYKEGGGIMDYDKLKQMLPENAFLVLGDVEETVPQVLDMFSPENPLGFVCLDLDYYWSTKEALKIFLGAPEKYLPWVAIYVDDIFLMKHNHWCGEYLAVDEFNNENIMRKIEQHRFLQTERIFKNARWIEQIFFLHILDHPVRSVPQRVI